MYATAQRVVSPTGPQGVNAYLYRHGEEEARIDWRRVDPGELTSSLPGMMVAQKTEIPPGGNHVRSFLDVVGPDSTSPDRIAEALRQFADSAPRECPFRSGDLSIQFSADYGLAGAEKREIEALSGRILAVLSAPAERPAQEPLRIDLYALPGSLVCALEPRDLARLADEQPRKWVSAEVRLEHTTEDDVRLYGQDYLLEIAKVLTGLPADRLASLGGVRFVAHASNEVLASILT